MLGKNAEAGTKGTVFLGRAWGDYARVVFQNSNLGGVISGAGWLGDPLTFFAFLVSSLYLSSKRP